VKRLSSILCSIWMISSVVNAANSGGKTDPAGVTTAEVRTLSERVPAGGTVQVKYLLTQPRPITSGGYGFAMDSFSVDGVSITSPLGDAAGVAVAQNGFLNLTVISPASDFGMNLDYPFITVTMDIPKSTPVGTTFPLDLTSASVQTPTGPLTFADAKPGTLTIGGSVAVRGVFPGGGLQAAGTVISVQGTGFQPGTKVATKMKTSTATFVSSTELRFVLQEAVNMDTQPIQVTNPDGSQVTFYSYLRGALVNPPSRDILKATEPVFQAQTHGVGTVPAASCGSEQHVALAIQNPNSFAVSVALTDQNTGSFSLVLLPSGGRVMDDVSALIGSSVDRQDAVSILSTAPVQMLGLCTDEAAGKVTPFLPSF
jgi:hypothetical protein